MKNTYFKIIQLYIVIDLKIKVYRRKINVNKSN